MKRLFCVALVLMFAAVFCAAQVPSSNHVVLLMEENQSYSSVIGNSAWPYLNSLANKYGVATQSYGNTHPSIGNYFMLSTGQILTNDDNQTPASFPVSADNMVRHMLTAGKTWKSYAESLPSVGYTGGNTSLYLVRHNPFPYFTDVQNSSAQKLNLVPFTQLATDLANGQLPEFSYISPNQMDDAHSGTPQAADAWLKQNLALLLASPYFQPGGDGLLIIQFDESVDSDTAHGGGHIATVLIGPKVKSGYKSTTLYQQQSVGKTIMEALGLTSFPGAVASAPDMAEFFGASAPAPTPTPTPTPTASGGVVVSSPGNGATVSSPVNFVASATGGSYPITAMRIYDNNNSAYSVNAASINTSLSLAAGSHNIVVQAWNSAGTVFKQTLTITVGASASAPTPTPAPTGTAGVTVSSPANGATVSSPTQFVASANGGSYPITAMLIYDNNNSAYSVNAASINTSLSLAAGSHNIVVQAWNSAGTVFKQALTISVGASAPAPTPAPTGTAGVTVSSPANGATVSSPTQFVASAISSNSSHPITAMRIYADGNSMYTVNAASLNTSLALAAGSHNVVIVAWDSSGASYTKNLSITEGGSSPAPAPTPTQGSTGVTIASPANGATVGSPTPVVASAAAPSGRSIVAMRVYLDSTSAYTVNASSLNTSLSMSSGAHKVTVNAWDNTGAVYVTSANITVGGSAPAPAPAPTPTPAPSTGFDPYPSNALVSSRMENANWISCNNCGGTGAVPTSQSLTQDGTSATVSVGGGSGISGWLWYSSFASTNASNWIMDYNVTPTNLTGAVALEFDGNQTGSLGNFVFGTECNYGYNPSQKTVWRFWTMSGGSQTWGTTSYACPITQVNHTYHVQMRFAVTTGQYQVARVKVTDLTTGAVVQDQSNLGTFSAVGSHGSSIDIQEDIVGGGAMAAKYQNVSIIRW